MALVKSFVMANIAGSDKKWHYSLYLIACIPRLKNNEAAI
jgi:hypothetical protein